MAYMYLGNESGGFDLVGTTNIKNIDFEEAKISKEDYEKLSEEEQKTGVYLVTGLDDTEDGGGRADLISYDNTNSKLGSTNVQGAIDELNSKINNEWTHVHVTATNTQIDVDLSSIEYIGVGGIVDSSATSEIDNVTILPVSVFISLNRTLQCFGHNGEQLFVANVSKVSDTKVNVTFSRFASAVLIYK